MDTFSAFTKSQLAKGNRQMVFDWDKAAKLIKEQSPLVASAGLGSDWEWTGGEIYRDGKPVHDSYTYLSSNWATPEIDLDGKVLECYTYEDITDFRSDTKWPESALKLLI